MDLLVLGAGGFLGRHVVTAATDAGHDVTVFSRRDTAASRGVAALVGDPQGDLTALRGRQWDAVFDTFSDPSAVASGRASSLSAVLYACLRAAGGTSGDVEWVWAGEQYLRDNLHDVEEEHRPLWFPEDQIPQDAIDASSALSAGLSFRSAEQTARDVLTQLRAEGRTDLLAGLDPPRERSLVDGWAGATGGAVVAPFRGDVS